MCVPVMSKSSIDCYGDLLVIWVPHFVHGDQIGTELITCGHVLRQAEPVNDLRRLHVTGRNVIENAEAGNGLLWVAVHHSEFGLDVQA